MDDSDQSTAGPAVALVAYGCLLFLACGAALLSGLLGLTGALVAYGIGAFAPMLALVIVAALRAHRRGGAAARARRRHA